MLLPMLLGRLVLELEGATNIFQVIHMHTVSVCRQEGSELLLDYSCSDNSACSVCVYNDREYLCKIALSVFILTQRTK